MPSPKSHYAKDIVFDKDTPIFATGKNEIIFVKSGAIDDKETEMMAVRWKIYFVFMRRFHSSNRKKFRHARSVLQFWFLEETVMTASPR